MNGSRASSATTDRRRLLWALFWGVSTLALAACIVVALVAGSRATVAMVVLSGLIIIGIAAALMASIVSPLPRVDSHHSSAGAWSGAGGGGGSDGGGSGGGDGGS